MLYIVVEFDKTAEAIRPLFEETSKKLNKTIRKAVKLAQETHEEVIRPVNFCDEGEYEMVVTPTRTHSMVLTLEDDQKTLTKSDHIFVRVRKCGGDSDEKNSSLIHDIHDKICAINERLLTQSNGVEEVCKIDSPLKTESSDHHKASNGFVSQTAPLVDSQESRKINSVIDNVLKTIKVEDLASTPATRKRVVSPKTAPPARQVPKSPPPSPKTEPKKRPVASPRSPPQPKRSLGAAFLDELNYSTNQLAESPAKTPAKKKKSKPNNPPSMQSNIHYESMYYP